MHASSIYLALADTAAPLHTALARAPEAHDQQLLDIDGTVLLNLGLFLIALFVLNKLLWQPYLRVRGERTSRIEGYKEDAKRLEADAAARLAKVEAKLAEARRAGSFERARVRTAAQAREQEVIRLAQASAQEALAAARARVDEALAKERANLAARAQALGQEAAEKVLGRKVA